ncbi:LEM domain-containing protein 1 isoform X2 [Conger conger]|uniref:LEM domain-containing protein 1 isoform X2 n=1 Tax=Conger conger TaxID=82655 RepID=UPI002A5ACB4C|nr:LEM domain-containing protein 1 isoform X2 [Conger conger]
MPVFVEDPAQFSKQRLKLELVANNVDLPAGERKKQVYLDLYMKYVSKKGAADFSSDEEDQVQGNDVDDPGVREEEEEEEDQAEESDVMDVTQLTDDELKAQLLLLGVKAGPIVDSTRVLYERKLQRLLDQAPQPDQNGTNEADQYSDSEEDNDDEEEDKPGGDDVHAGPEPVAVAMVTGSRHSQLGSKPVGLRSVDDENYYYPQCFIPSSRMRVKHEAPRKWDAEPQGNLSATADRPVGVSPYKSREGSRVASPSPSTSNYTSASTSISSSFSITQMVEELENRSPHSSSRAAAVSRSSWSLWDREPACGSASLGRAVRKMDKCTMTGRSPLRPRSPLAGPGAPLYRLQCKAPVTDVLTEMFPDANRTPTGIAATRRRPIKGAAGRPVQYKYPDTPLSPPSLERLELQQRLVPVWVQALVFLGVAALLYLIYGAMEDSLEGPFSALLDNLSQGAGPAEEAPPLPELQDSPAPLLAEEY